MGSARASLCLVAVLTVGGALDARAAEPTAETTAIGPYRVERTGTAIAISRAGDRTVGLALLAGGLVVAGIGRGLRGSGRVGAGTAVLLLGLGIAAVGGVSVLATERWRANDAELARERPGGRVERWPRAAITAVEIHRRAASADDFKRARIRPWDVTVRSRAGGRLPARFSVSSEADARALARQIATALRIEVADPT